MTGWLASLRPALATLVLLATPAFAQEPTAAPAPSDDGTDAVPSENETLGFTAPDQGPPLSFGGYIDVGFAKAQGNGSSFPSGDTRLPADYGVDAFAPAVNSRGDVASTDSGGRFTNGFLPRSLGLDGRPSAFISTVSADVRYQTPGTPVMVFSRLQLLPRFTAAGDETRLVVDQAFGKLTPFDSHELTLSVGKFDSVFGIEYLDREAPIRTGITPSLFARYTTGTSVGAKAFYRQQIAPLWSALSLNVAATNSAPFIDALQTSALSLTGRPVASGRLGYELNLPRLQVKLGGSAMRGPRNDQGDPHAQQKAWAGDARLYAFGLSLSGEYVDLRQDQGRAADKRTPLGPQTIPSAFHVRGFYGVLAYELPWSAAVLRKITLHGRFEQRHHEFEGFTPVTVRRITAGLRLDLWDVAALKGEYLLNREAAGAPTVDNDVLALSLIWIW